LGDERYQLYSNLRALDYSWPPIHVVENGQVYTELSDEHKKEKDLLQINTFNIISNENELQQSFDITEFKPEPLEESVKESAQESAQEFAQESAQASAQEATKEFDSAEIKPEPLDKYVQEIDKEKLNQSNANESSENCKAFEKTNSTKDNATDYELSNVQQSFPKENDIVFAESNSGQLAGLLQENNNLQNKLSNLLSALKNEHFIKTLAENKQIRDSLYNLPLEDFYKVLELFGSEKINNFLTMLFLLASKPESKTKSQTDSLTDLQAQLKAASRPKAEATKVLKIHNSPPGLWVPPQGGETHWRSEAKTKTTASLVASESSFQERNLPKKAIKNNLSLKQVALQPPEFIEQLNQLRMQLAVLEKKLNIPVANESLHKVIFNDSPLAEVQSDFNIESPRVNRNKKQKMPMASGYL
jgi:hypothetical protein